jgi:hypothetical protein
MPPFQAFAESLARLTSRRGFLGRGADLVTGTVIGLAAGASLRADNAQAHHSADHTVCVFPGPPCPCNGCFATGVCAKPCLIMTQFYSSGCWVSFHSILQRQVNCCDCDCNGRVPGFPSTNVCGCGDDHHNNSLYCPSGNASGPLK